MVYQEAGVTRCECTIYFFSSWHRMNPAWNVKQWPGFFTLDLTHLGSITVMLLHMLVPWICSFFFWNAFLLIHVYNSIFKNYIKTLMHFFLLCSSHVQWICVHFTFLVFESRCIISKIITIFIYRIYKVYNILYYFRYVILYIMLYIYIKIIYHTLYVFTYEFIT